MMYLHYCLDFVLLLVDMEPNYLSGYLNGDYQTNRLHAIEKITWYDENRACKWVTIHGVTPRDWSLLGTKRDTWGLVTRIIF